jgi:hypothetical protein
MLASKRGKEKSKEVEKKEVQGEIYKDLQSFP